MKVVWNGTDSYRAFVHENPPRFCLISSRFDEKAQAVTVGSVLVLVFDARHCFCDLELICAISGVSQQPPVSAQGWEGELATSLPVTDSVQWNYSQATGTIHVEMGQVAQPLHWFRLGMNTVWIGVSQQQEMRAILCSSAVIDPSGEEQGSVAKFCFEGT